MHTAGQDDAVSIETGRFTKAPVQPACAKRHFSALFAALLLALSMPAAPVNAGSAEPQGPVFPVPLPVIVTAVTGWVAAELGEPIPHEMPAIVFVDRAAMSALARLGGMLPAPDPASDKEVQALYLSDSRTIALPSDWSGASAAQISILVHEVVHHFQAIRGDTYPCPAARERLAYDVQERWLEAYGENLEGAFGVDPLFRLIVTNCLF